MQASDWNAVSFGDDCIVAGFLQFHTFEDMMLKVKRTDIRDGSAVNFGATVMGGAVIEPETTLLPLSMVLKEMHLPTATLRGQAPWRWLLMTRYDSDRIKVYRVLLLSFLLITSFGRLPRGHHWLLEVKIDNYP